MTLTIDELKRQDLIVLECLSGSRAYGLDTPQSDTDIKGVFVLPEDLYYGFDYIEQVSSEKNDVVFYELKKFLQLLAKSNPSAIELLCTQGDSVLFKAEQMQSIDPAAVLSKTCRDTFAGYALSQVKRAKGLNKKIFNPVSGEVPRAIEFCYVTVDGQSVPVAEWLYKNKLDMARCGLSAIPHVRDGYALYYADDSDAPVSFAGIFRSGARSDGEHLSSEVSLSSIPKGMLPRTYLFFNKDEFSRRHREYQEYKEWERSRNTDRYQSTLAHGGGYDAKNMMHTFRLLRMAGEIATLGRPLIKRPDRDELLRIKVGAYSYEDLMTMAVDEIKKVDGLFAASKLREEPDAERIEAWAIAIRREWYRNRSGC